MPYLVVSEILHGMDATEAYDITLSSPRNRAHGKQSRIERRLQSDADSSTEFLHEV